MKNFLLIAVIFVLALPFCGTIDGWSEKYFDASTDTQKLDALKFIHCETIVEQFNGDPREVQLLDSLLQVALDERDQIESPDKYVINLVFKNYVRFDLEDYDGLKTTIWLSEGAGMTTKQLRKVIRNIPKNDPIRKDDNIGESHEVYALQIAQEIDAIYQ